MITILILSVVTLCITIIMGLYVFRINPRNKVNVTFIALALLLVLSNCVLIALHLVPDADTAVFLYRAGAASGTIFGTLLIILVTFASDIFTLYGIRKYQHVLFLIIGAVQAVHLYNNYSIPLFVSLARVDGTWRLTGILDHAHFMFTSSHWLVSTVTCGLMLFLWKKKTKSIREKKQATVLLASFALGCGVTVVYMVFLIFVFKLVENPIAGDSAFFFFIWTAGIWYCIYRYRFLSITPDYISGEVLSNINESVILVNPEKKIVMLNKRARELLNGGGTGDVLQFSKNIPEYSMIDNKAQALLEGRGGNFSCRVSYFDGSGNARHFNARFSLVRDRFDDILGVLIIAREDKDLQHLQSFYNITGRQMDIISMAVSGLSNRELAAHLAISEKTVENHMINIYNKLGINNKIELYNLVKQYSPSGADG